MKSNSVANSHPQTDNKRPAIEAEVKASKIPITIDHSKETKASSVNYIHQQKPSIPVKTVLPSSAGTSDDKEIFIEVISSSSSSKEESVSPKFESSMEKSQTVPTDKNNSNKKSKKQQKMERRQLRREKKMKLRMNRLHGEIHKKSKTMGNGTAVKWIASPRSSMRTF